MQTMNRSDHHMEGLRLPYLEGLLSPEEKADFEDHIHDCPVCRAKLAEMNHWASTLAANAQAMCPEPWELFDYVTTGKDALGIVSSHLDKCPSCSEVADSFRTHADREGVPGHLWEKMRGTAGEPPAERRTAPLSDRLIELLDRLWFFCRPVVLVPAAVAATVLLLIVFYPTHPATRLVALSSVTWTPESSTLNIMGDSPPESLPADAKKKRLAVVILLTNFKQPPDQNRIDSFYRSIEPPINIRDRYDLVSPAVFDHAIGRDPARPVDDQSIVAGMRSKLEVSEVLLVEIVQSGKSFSIEARLRNTGTGSITKETDTRNLTEGELIPKLGDVLLDMLNHQSVRQ
jgi:hypothetical protein